MIVFNIAELRTLLRIFFAKLRAATSFAFDGGAGDPSVASETVRRSSNSIRCMVGMARCRKTAVELPEVPQAFKLGIHFRFIANADIERYSCRR